MATRIPLPHTACLGIDAPNGQVYHTRRGKPGVVEVDNPAHAKLFKSALGSAEQVVGFATSDVPGKVCARCSFHAFEFSTACPRCGSTEFTEELA
ncbi:MAG: hypothetical protein ACYDAY_11450 [Candidatus Dormibacteria bacterium]